MTFRRIVPIVVKRRHPEPPKKHRPVGEPKHECHKPVDRRHPRRRPVC